MAKPTIVTRAGKGSALTWTEGDSNLTNLRDATITVTDGTNSKAIDLNGTITYTAGTNVTLSVNASTGAVTINSTQPTSVATLTTPRAIYGNNFDGSAALTQVIASTYGGTGNGFTKFSGPTTAERTFTLPDASSTIVVQGGALGTPTSGTVTNLTGTASININGTVGATTPTTGAFTTLTASSTSSLTLGQNGVALGSIIFANSTAGGTTTLGVPANSGTFTFNLPSSNGSTQNLLTTNGSGQTSWTSSITGTFTFNNGIANNPKLAIGTTSLNSTAWTTTGIGLRVSAATYTDTSSTAGTVAASHVHAVAASTLASTNAITVTDAASLYVAAAPTAGTNTTITNGWAILAGGRIKATDFTGTIGATTASTGAFTTLGSSGLTTANSLTVTTSATLKDIRETVSTVTYASTITPDVANGTVQTVTLTGNVTFSAFANPVTGQSLTLFVIQDGTGSRTLTSTMKFSGASKTLSTAASSIDIITVFYDGTSYYASLAKGFA